MEQKLFSEIRSLYVSDKKKPVDIRIRIRMRDLIDPEALHHAVETTMKRYPLYLDEDLVSTVDSQPNKNRFFNAAIRWFIKELKKK